MSCEVEEAVMAVRRSHPCWGGRKIHHVLRRRGQEPLPHASTITDILHRHDLIAPEESAKRRPFVRFERAAPNELWQMDFKGHFPVGGSRCHPLVVEDDHSRFAVALVACANERRRSVQPALIGAFREYGLPEAILIDNGPPWGRDFEHRHTKLTAWLMQLGIAPHHGRPYHPQTRGKVERFNGTLQLEAVAGENFGDLLQVQSHFDAWRHIYNHERPHQAIGDEPPASRFRKSPRAFPETLAPITYGPDCLIRRVQRDGRISLMNRNLFVSNAFAGQPIGLRPTERDGVFEVLFCAFKVGTLDVTGRQELEA
jgi:transposase InsO family protein